MIDDGTLAKAACNTGGARQECPCNGLLKTKLCCSAPHAPGEPLPVNPARQRVAVERNRDRRKHIDVLGDLAASVEGLPQLAHGPAQIARGGLRIPCADRVDPQYPVATREPCHDVLLAQGITVPVVREADNVSSLKRGRLGVPGFRLFYHP